MLRCHTHNTEITSGGCFLCNNPTNIWPPLSKFIVRELPTNTIGTVTPEGVFTLNWNGQSIQMNNIEEAKTVALILFRLVFERMPATYEKVEEGK